MAPRKPTHDPCAKIIEHDRLLNGNGEKGILEKVEEHEAFIQQLRGAKAAVVAILGSSLLGVILQSVARIKK